MLAERRVVIPTDSGEDDASGGATPSPLFDPIGRVAAEGPHLEQSLRFLLAALSRNEETITKANAISLGNLIDHCKDARKAATLPEPLNSETQKLLVKAAELKRRRDDIIHAFWHGNPDITKGLMGMIPMRRQLGMTPITTETPEEIRQVAAEIYLLCDDLLAAIMNIFNVTSGAGFPAEERASRLMNPNGYTPDGRSAPLDQTSD